LTGLVSQTLVSINVSEERASAVRPRRPEALVRCAENYAPEKTKVRLIPSPIQALNP
jgi:hypothetical protein